LESYKTKTGALDKALSHYFGYNTFKPLQKEVIENVLKGNDTVVLMPTGGGKSICYQLPSLIFDGLTVVVSPLIALMKDQVEALQANGIAAAYLNSSLSDEQYREVSQQLQNGSLRLLYVAPERLFSGNFMQYLKTLPVRLFAIDEAHCVSSWGHHFRPEYKKLAALKNVFPDIPVVALTATADKAVRSDIGDLLNLSNPRYFIASFDRPNLSLAVLPGQRKWEQILRIVKRHLNKSGIIYCLSRKATENLAGKLQAAGINAKFYHAGLENEERQRTQEEFLQGQVDVICATIAFGMGIDKSNIRFVIHYNMPGNLESYYQEIGRAGRDGKPAETVLFYSYRDVQNQLSFIDQMEDGQYKKIQSAKLKRMQEFAEGHVCRRKILLSYFGEIPQEDCGNCDVCQNPPRYFDGTIQAQIALSAIHRVREKASVTALIDILKGHKSDVIKANGFDTIKTFGKGESISAFAWQMFIQQLVHQGIVEIDYKDHYTLKLNEESRKVLFENKKVRLISPEVIRQRQNHKKETKTLKDGSNKNLDSNLFEELRKLRKRLADHVGKPAFTVFTDNTLQDMVEKMPQSYDEFLEVEGVGDHKAQKYAPIFLRAIANSGPRKKTNNTYMETWQLYQSGKTIGEIAHSRNIQHTTVYSHLAKLIEDDFDINLFDLISEKELMQIKQAVHEIGKSDKLKPYFEFLKGEVPYGKIRIALSYFKKAELI
jgi:ATP-dependent DNA helicase RecQ